MCGIAGFFSPSATLPQQELLSLCKGMTDRIILRGPDSEGQWADPERGVALGHRRLSILDLSPGGHQPMTSASGRYVMVFNGEVYNFQDLRAELEALGRSGWRGHSDTEVMLAAFEQWGVEAAIPRFNGMFAFALWDRQERQLHLSRDRVGEKPLYYGWCQGTLLFGSELKALKAHPKWNAPISRDALTTQLRLNYIPDPLSIYEGISKLPPAAWITFNEGGQTTGPKIYWDIKKVAEQSKHNPFRGTDQEAIDELERHLMHSVKQRMVADVPLGAFLSGGVDSSTIVALMQKQSTRPVKTFTIGFHEKNYNEAIYAKEVAQHLGTEHTELYVTPKDALDVIPLIPSLYDEPFSDYSQIPTYLVCKMARQHVTVALSGDAGDELFTGYERYFVGRSLWNKVRPLPKPVRFGMAGAMTALKATTWNKVLAPGKALLPAKYKHVSVGDKLHKLAEVLRSAEPIGMYRELLSHWKHPEQIVLGSKCPTTLYESPELWPDVADFEHRMMHLDMETYLPGDILTKVDRAAMGVSLEGRIPLLDQHVMEFAWRVPTHMKIRHGKGKWLLRQVLYKHVPEAMIDRPKMGFSVPIGTWLRGELRDWGESLLSETRLKNEGFFDPKPIRKMWDEHQRDERNWQYYLWDILMFQAWLDAQ
jgi:asparagine synthase (glutamine-hydrolysing)